jgi:FkbM family methyltransferase
MISYAQNFEDVILHRCFAGQKEGFYIDVGAMDPVLHSVTKAFYDEGWSGINIEPNEAFYSKLLQERPRDMTLNVAVGEREETRPWHLFREYGLSTFDDHYRDRFVAQGFEVEEKTARITTLAAICQEYVHRKISFLKIDCEGWETFAIKGADWERFRPIVVIVEATEPLSTTPSWSEWEPLLIENGHYEMVYFDGLNRFYLQREYSDLRRHFQVPPNVFDDFTPYTTFEALEKVDRLTRERDSMMARVVQLSESLRQAQCDIGELTTRVAAREATVSALEELVATTRLWVGQLSQELAACRLQHHR